MKLTRRGFITWTTIAGVSINAGCTGTSGEQGSSDQRNGGTSPETTSIAVAKSGDEVVETAQVPVKWKKQNDQAEKVEQLVQRKYGNIKGVRSVEIVNSSETIGEYHYSAIEIGVVPGKAEQIDKEIPDEMKNVTIKVVQREGTAVPA